MTSDPWLHTFVRPGLEPSEYDLLMVTRGLVIGLQGLPTGGQPLAVGLQKACHQVVALPQDSFRGILEASSLPGASAIMPC